ncbi:MAG: ATPase [Candidatus Bipolaricaulis sibiricus]|uniref:ATPase n=1 Tax=Bipolaricaulis sibiricus TaxID=2501609 RepID=A0A410FSE0_BIPS1|nr:MAG: ATPase [Candidatus Bipolaricaulis sibiricus]
MSKCSNLHYTRAHALELRRRLGEPRRFMQVVAGPRQTGKTTLVRQVLQEWGETSHYASADEPTLRDRTWLVEQWEVGRALAHQAGRQGAVLALDEIQKIPQWAETVKRLWDEDTATAVPLRVVLLGSAPLLVGQGLSESLAGRFELLHVPHWSLAEMKAAFGFTLAEYLYFGGYPGGAKLADDPARWRRYIVDSLVETTIARDILLLTRVDKPALLRQLFQLACTYSGQILSYTKMLGQLQDAGNTTTLAHYLDLLAGAGMVTGLPKYSGSVVRQRGSIPKLQAYNTALLTAPSGLSPEEAQADREFWGHLVESAVGAHLVNAGAAGTCAVHYWRQGNREVDFVVQIGRQLLAIEVKAGRRRDALPGMGLFLKEYPQARPLLVGGDGIPLERFLSQDVSSWASDDPARSASAKTRDPRRKKGS